MIEVFQEKLKADELIKLCCVTYITKLQVHIEASEINSPQVNISDNLNPEVNSDVNSICYSPMVTNYPDTCTAKS
jgi:hypothetical protein